MAMERIKSIYACVVTREVIGFRAGHHHVNVKGKCGEQKHITQETLLTGKTFQKY